jgi:quinol-cytochrome oxidoreductase complex cytochrome b subunit
MSYWGATVITNLFSAIPVFGQSIVTLLWGGFTIDNPTLVRFYSLHYLLPFVIVAVVFLHLIALHQHGSNNPLGIDKKGPQDSLPFHPYYTVKDLFGFCVFLLIYAACVFYIPNSFIAVENFVPVNPMLTPPHIVPEWYFLPFYAMLRAVPDIVFVPAKLAGVIAMSARSSSSSCCPGSILLECAVPAFGRFINGFSGCCCSTVSSWAGSGATRRKGNSF